MTFVNPANLIAQLDLPTGIKIADLGCGGGYFCIPAARLAGSEGTVYAVDIMRPRLEATISSARHSGLSNVVPVLADLEKPITGIPPTSCDWVFMSNIVHQVENKHALFSNAYKILKTGGRVLMVEWKKGSSLFGPPQGDRVNLQELEVLCERLGFRLEKHIENDSSHFAVVFVK